MVGPASPAGPRSTRLDDIAQHTLGSLLVQATCGFADGKGATRTCTSLIREALVELVGALRKAPAVAIDTEFMRERTYYARLCLIQLALRRRVVRSSIRWRSTISRRLRDLLTDPDVVKVFHAGSQDLEIFYRLCGVPRRRSSTRRSPRRSPAFRSRWATARSSRRSSA